VPAGHLRSIGAILPLLKVDFPDTSISKIRFLEQEGLLSPERAPSGYRRYSPDDIERLRYILTMQRDYFMPLKVIRERLDKLDAGVEPPPIDTPDGIADVAEPVARPEEDDNDVSAQRKAIKLTKRELIQLSGLSEASFVELERQRMITLRHGTLHYGREALMICVCARKLQAYGMDIRYLLAIKQAAEREAGLVEQSMSPLRRNPQAGDILQDIANLVIQAHAAMMYTVLQH
jgi:DNA-binding transcriptional MerR regulator